ncbi:hypothetical protein IFM89_009018 [Coptis chinensis]|uniref:Uncharacterized protein n=1 Tax=Coptis chinensis TaxID=261450 RepID=A0A835I1L1_9MAGN|nr:hypothetical protein IFM89_009018 [Coptis chinensis]
MDSHGADGADLLPPLHLFYGRTAGNGSPGGSRSLNGSDRKRFRRPYQSKSFKVQISYAVKIPMKSIVSALRGQESENSQEA